MFSVIKIIAVFSILTGIISNMLPNKGYKRYVNLFVGTVMILLIIKPIMSYDLKKVVNKAFKDNTKNTIYIKEGNLESVKEALRRQIERDIEEYLSGYGYQVKSLQIDIDTNQESTEFGALKEICLVYVVTDGNTPAITIKPISINSTDEVNEETEAIKQYITMAYNITAERVSVIYEG